MLLGFVTVILSIVGIIYCTLAYHYMNSKASQNDGYIPTCLTSSCFLNAAIDEADDELLLEQLLANDNLGNIDNV